ncbi:ribbon-helix-helix protein, CopG family [Candidatus Chloroploca sp. M-50]|uniref:ChpI protein n=2 Tax=Candidatus Chloroploca TaxID=1579476 RepID=A0A2H3KRU9_9CHLR|nr:MULTISPECIES: ribbon-helix-helix protein, CopG family [Candidatus Chloroploca]MBP1468700.1 ribbon-helix-helix protein, CopG family [Candidatus Chloroploca mongolica]PDW01388.1 ChpI protein [Candidatus Chloroploca asiatica]
MKTAISIPDALFKAAEEYARAQGLSRSELFARALQVYLDAHHTAQITAALDQVYDAESSTLDPAFNAAQRRLLAGDDW